MKGFYSHKYGNYSMFGDHEVYFLKHSHKKRSTSYIQREFKIIIEKQKIQREQQGPTHMGETV